MVMSFCAVLFPTRVLDEILNLIESVSEGFPSYFCKIFIGQLYKMQGLGAKTCLSHHSIITKRHIVTKSNIRSKTTSVVCNTNNSYTQVDSKFNIYQTNILGTTCICFCLIHIIISVKCTSE